MANTRNHSIEYLKDIHEGCWVVTDPCYVLTDDNYQNHYLPAWGNKWNRESLTYKGVEIPLASNGGDGYWSFHNGIKDRVCENTEIALDSGTLAAIPIELCDHNWGRYGMLFRNKPEIGEEDGYFVINGVRDDSCIECEKCFEYVRESSVSQHPEHGWICEDCTWTVEWDDEDDS